MHGMAWYGMDRVVWYDMAWHGELYIPSFHDTARQLILSTYVIVRRTRQIIE